MTIIPFRTTSYSLEKENLRVCPTFKAKQGADDDLFIKDALGATSAALTYFPYKKNVRKDVETIYDDIDGGIN